MEFSIEPLGDQCVIIQFFGKEITFLCRHVRALDVQLSKAKIPGVVETVPAYASLAVTYNPLIVQFVSLRESLTNTITSSFKSNVPEGKHFEIPVCYEEMYAPDLGVVAAHSGLTTDQVILRHSQPHYLVAMIGFTPGFPYLLGLPDELSTPRKSTPRHVVAAGSVGIGGAQTGIYSLETPGGWNIIGRTPIRLFRQNNANPSLLSAGDTVKFVPVDEASFRTIKEEADGKREYSQ